MAVQVFVCELCTDQPACALLELKRREVVHTVQLCSSCCEAVEIMVDDGSFDPESFLELVATVDDRLRSAVLQ